MMVKAFVQVFVAAATALTVGLIGGASAIETVDSLDVNKYVGRWYQVKPVISSIPSVLLWRCHSWCWVTRSCRRGCLFFSSESNFSGNNSNSRAVRCSTSSSQHVSMLA